MKLTLLVLFLGIIQFSFAQEITEENYRKEDDALWEWYTQEIQNVIAGFEKYPDKADSLQTLANQLGKIADKKNQELAIKYVSVPGGLQRVFMLRLTLPKDTLMTLLKSIPEEMQNSPYGKSLLQHIETTQVTEGSRYYDFKATDTEGKEFTLSSLEGKKILLLYEGLGCMGDNARNFLKRTYKETSRDDFEIVIYWATPDLEELQKIKAAYECDFILVTDFLEDHNPVKIHYGAQATPSTYFIDKEGMVQLKTTGINSKKISELVNR